MLLPLVLYLLFASRHADAYLDPGSGSVFFQALLATLLASIYTIRLYWRRIRSFLSGRRKTETTKKGQEPTDP